MRRRERERVRSAIEDVGPMNLSTPVDIVMVAVVVVEY